MALFFDILPAWGHENTCWRKYYLVQLQYKKQLCPNFFGIKVEKKTKNFLFEEPLKEHTVRPCVRKQWSISYVTFTTTMFYKMLYGAPLRHVSQTKG